MLGGSTYSGEKKSDGEVAEFSDRLGADDGSDIKLAVKTPLGVLILLLMLAGMLSAWGTHRFLYKPVFERIEKSDKARDLQTSEMIMTLKFSQKISILFMPIKHAFFAVNSQNRGKELQTPSLEIIVEESLEAERYLRDIIEFRRGHGRHFSERFYLEVWDDTIEQVKKADALFLMMTDFAGLPTQPKNEENRKKLLADISASVHLIEAEVKMIISRLSNRMPSLRLSYNEEYKNDEAAQAEILPRVQLLSYGASAFVVLSGLLLLFIHGRRERGNLLMSENKNRYHGLIEFASDAIIVADAKTGIIIDSNRMASEFTGRTKEEIVGTNHLELYPEELRGEYQQIFEEHVRHGKGVAPEMLMLRKDGSRLDVGITGTLLQISGRTVVQGIFRDITEHKLMLKEQEILLAQSVQSIKEAEDAKKKAEKANQLKSDFLANMSHELRTPLSSVLGFTKLGSDYQDRVLNDFVEIEKEINRVLLAISELFIVSNQRTKKIKADNDTVGIDKEAVEAVESALNSLKSAKVSMQETGRFNNIVIQQGEKLLNLINDLLDLSQIEAGQLDVVAEPVSACYLLSSVHNALISAAVEKNITLKTNMSSFLEDDLIFVGDQKRLEQIFQNLGENAIKYSDAGTVKLGIRAEEGKLLLEVLDEGCGLSKHDTEVIFDRFRQLDGSMTRSQGGVGLGLSLVESLIKAMKGTVSVTSKVGEGSCFTVSLPLEMVKTDSSGKLSTAEEYLIQGKNILLVEDDPSIRMLIGEMLKGNEILFAEDGAQGLEAIEDKKDFDVILLDMHMPKVSGTELLKHLPDNFYCPIVVISADGTVEKEQEVYSIAKEKGITLEYLVKPVASKTLQETFARLAVG